MANVIDTMSEACNSGCRITTLTVYIQLRIVSVRMEVDVVPVKYPSTHLVTGDDQEDALVRPGSDDFKHRESWQNG